MHGAQTIGAKSQRERDYIAAVAELYKDFQTVDHPTRIAAYERAMARVASTYPDDSEAQIFAALAALQTAPPTDKTYAKQLQAGAVLERMFAAAPDHPGLAHYIIHAYDVPPLAPRALDAARRYAQIAPSAPHALHMPSHTFTRVGYWRESVETNLASAAAAEREGSTGEELHALDYQVYAYLQMGQDDGRRKGHRGTASHRGTSHISDCRRRRGAGLPQAATRHPPFRHGTRSSAATGSARHRCSPRPSRASRPGRWR